MVRKILSLFDTEIRGLHEAAYLLGAFAFLSQLLALVRDRLLAGTFGASSTLDVYYAAFRIPDFLFATVASLLSLYALLPVLSRFEKEHPGLMLSFLRQTLSLFFVAMGSVALIIFYFAPQLLRLVTPGFATDPAAFDKLLLLTRILLLQPILLGASNILANLTQLRHRFVLYSVSPLLYNVGIIVGVVVLYPYMGATGLAWGVVLGALLHFMVQLPFFMHERVSEPLPFSRVKKALGEVLTLSVPRTFTLAAGQLSLLAIVGLASYLAKGSISIFSFAYNLQAVPLTIIGVSYSVAAFPTLSRLFAENHHQEFLQHVSDALRHIFFWAFPATALIIVLRAHLVRLILGSGAFDWTATRLTAAALALFVLSLVAQSAVLVIARAYYAAGKTARPLVLAIISVFVSIVSSFALVTLFQNNVFVREFFESLLRVTDTGDASVIMLALGYALGPIVQCVLGLVFLSKDFRFPLRDFRRLFLESVTAATLGGAAAYGVLTVLGSVISINTTIGVFLQGFWSGIAGLCVTAAVFAFLKNREFFETLAAIRARFAAKAAVAPALEPTDISS